jgi:hypothetical protein
MTAKKFKNALKFKKVSAAGLMLPADATEWEGVYIPELEMIVGADVLPCGEVSWKKAQAAAAKATLCGAKAERSPSRMEYAHMIDDALYGPTLDPAYFRNAGNFTCEWSSTECVPAGCAWQVHLGSGRSNRNGKLSFNHVRAARTSQFSDFGVRTP